MNPRRLARDLAGQRAADRQRAGDLRRVLDAGNVSRAARILGIDRRTLYPTRASPRSDHWFVRAIAEIAAEQPAAPPRSITMVASCAAPMSSQTCSETARRARLHADAEAAFRDVLAGSLAGLALCDRNLVTFHYFHGLTVDQLAEMFYRPRAAVVRQLGRIRERLLRETRRGLASRLVASKRELDRVLDLACSHLDHAITRLLRG